MHPKQFVNATNKPGFDWISADGHIILGKGICYWHEKASEMVESLPWKLERILSRTDSTQSGFYLHFTQKTALIPLEFQICTFNTVTLSLCIKSTTK